MQEKYSLNEQTLKYILDFERKVESAKTFTIQELVDLFEGSSFNKEQFSSYKKPKNSSIWYALRRSENWYRISKGTYRRR